MPVTRVSGLPLPATAGSSGPAFVTSVSGDGRYLLDQRGHPFLINADSGWAAATKLNATDQATYLADRAANGFNALLTDLVGTPSTGGNAAGTNWNGEAPFTGTFVLNSTYWARIDTFLQLAASYGISVFAYAIDFYAVSGGVFASMTNAQASTFAAALAARYASTATYPGIVWNIGNDWGGDGTGTGCCGSGFVTQYQAFLSGLAGAGDTRLTTIELGFYETLATDGATVGPTVPINWGYSYHPTYEVIIRGRAAAAKPVLHGEGAYENAVTGFPSTALDIRKQVLWTLTSGGCGQFYGNDSLWAFTTGWQAQLDTTMVAQRKAFMAVIAQYDWWKLAPDTGSALVTAGRGTQWPTSSGPNAGSTTPMTNDATYGHYVTAAFSADGKIAMVYNPDSSTNTITLSAAPLGASPTITKVDPTSGTTSSLGWTTAPSGGANAAGDHDWLYVITAT